VGTKNTVNIIMTDQFFCELDQLEYDAPALLEMALAMPVMCEMYERTEAIWDGLSAEHKQLEPIAAVLSQLNHEYLTGWVGFQYTRPRFHMPAHTDESSRKSCLIIPLTPRLPAPIYWQDGQHGPVICEHVYRKPTVINTEIWHGVRNHNRLRINLQIGIIPEYAQSVSLARNGGFFA